MENLNDKILTINDLKKIVKDFCDDRNWSQFHNPKDLAIGISTEAGELLDLFRFKNSDEINDMMINDIKKERISEELSDVLYFVLRFSEMYEFDLSTSLKSKIEKNNKKYPVEKSKDSNKKYNEV